ncbi:MAG: hypothetical protein SFU91_00670 [Chloroherpetonaceae bacterium]|nr:hypothetical protein [Chloroherpetonaceae bacterium]
MDQNIVQEEIKSLEFRLQKQKVDIADLEVKIGDNESLLSNQRLQLTRLKNQEIVIEASISSLRSLLV